MTRNKHYCFLALIASALAANADSSLPVPDDMARIASGSYRPLFRSVTGSQIVVVKSFLIDRLPVSNGEFLEFLQTNPAWRRSKVKKILADESYLKSWAGDLDLGPNVLSNAPVTYVSWFAAKAYAHGKGKRMPTVAEWEYTAGASSTRPDGDKDMNFQKQVLQWYCAPAEKQGSPRGVHTPNYWGVHDLHGLVWEWVADFNTPLATGDISSDSGADRDRFCGAGSVRANDVANFPAFMRYGFRSSLKANYCIHNLGFRCAKDL